MIPLYKTKAISVGGRKGHVKVENSQLEFDMALPHIGGPSKTGANPEQLFAAAYAACFGSATEHEIHAAKLPVTDYSISVEISIGPELTGGFDLGAEIELKVSGIDQAAADKLVADANEGCPYSRATRGNIRQKLVATVIKP